MNIMKEAHAWAKAHRKDYASYKKALSEGLKIMHHRAAAQNRGAETRELMRERLEERMKPLLLLDWKSPQYNGIRDFCRYAVVR